MGLLRGLCCLRGFIVKDGPVPTAGLDLVPPENDAALPLPIGGVGAFSVFDAFIYSE